MQRILQYEKSDDRRHDHHNQRADRDDVARGCLASKADARRCDCRERRALPKKMKQRKSEHPQNVWSEPVSKGVHRAVLSYSSKSFRSSSISFFELRRPASAWSINSLADPSNTR